MPRCSLDAYFDTSGSKRAPIRRGRSQAYLQASATPGHAWDCLGWESTSPRDCRQLSRRAKPSRCRSGSRLLWRRRPSMRQSPPSSASIAAASSPLGSTAASWAEHLPEEAVVGVAATVVADCAAASFRRECIERSADEFADGFVLRGSVPARAAFTLVMYALWCLLWWISIVRASMCGSSASYA